jgi:tubulin--tyrosine ligase
LDPAKLSDPFVHLSNHCIQTGHPDYGKYEPTNEMFFAEFREHLDGEYEGRDVLDGVVVPQVRSIVAATMAAAKDQMKNMDGNPYKSFNVFGYDFMVDTDLKVSLIEINSSPAVAGALLPDFTKSLVEKAIDPLFPVPASDADVASAADEKENSDKVAGVGAAGEKEGAGKAAGPSSAGQSSSAWVVCEQCHFGFDVEKST